MTGEISNALEILGAINKDAVRRLDRLEEDLYGKDGIRVLITQLATRLEHVPDKIDALAEQVTRLQAAEDGRESAGAGKRGIWKWVVNAAVAMTSAIAGAYFTNRWSKV